LVGRCSDSARTLEYFEEYRWQTNWGSIKKHMIRLPSLWLYLGARQLESALCLPR